MGQFKTRALSAVVAVVFLIATLYFFNTDGLYYLCLGAVALATYEVSKLLSFNDFPHFFKINFFVLSYGSFLFLAQDKFKDFSHLISLFIFLWIVVLSIFFHKRFESINSILKFVALSFLGSFYVCFLPLTIVWLLKADQGISWFITVLAVVFSGDVGAYIFGSLWGKRKIAPVLSPKKSLEGSFGGLSFSLVAALVCRYYFFSELSIYIFIFTGLFGGALGQVGDFFESLMKRIAGVKDSGKIMPGHGGILDRIDGVLFAAPLFYFAAFYLSRMN